MTSAASTVAVDPSVRGGAPATSILRAADRDFGAARLRLFRAYLTCQVETASPPLLDLGAHLGMDLVRALRGMRPPNGWPLREAGRKCFKSLGADGHDGRQRLGRQRLPERAVGAAADRRAAETHRLQVVLDGSTLDVRVWLGGAMLRTGDGALYVWLPERLPETVAASARDRPLIDVVDHPVLRSRPYRIGGVLQVGDRSVLAVSAPAVPIRLPDLNSRP